MCCCRVIELGGHDVIEKVIEHLQWQNAYQLYYINTHNNYYYKLSLTLESNETIYLLGYPDPERFGYYLHSTQGVFKYVDSELHFSIYSCPGNSGGPLLDTSNNVIGILVSGISIGHLECSYIVQGEPIKYAIQIGLLNNVPLINGYFQINNMYTMERAKQEALDNEAVVMIFADVFQQDKLTK